MHILGSHLRPYWIRNFWGWGPVIYVLMHLPGDFDLCSSIRTTAQDSHLPTLQSNGFKNVFLLPTNLCLPTNPSSTLPHSHVCSCFPEKAEKSLLGFPSASLCQIHQPKFPMLFSCPPGTKKDGRSPSPQVSKCPASHSCLHSQALSSIVILFLYKWIFSLFSRPCVDATLPSAMGLSLPVIQTPKRNQCTYYQHPFTPLSLTLAILLMGLTHY